MRLINYVLSFPCIPAAAAAVPVIVSQREVWWTGQQQALYSPSMHDHSRTCTAERIMNGPSGGPSDTDFRLELETLL